MSVRTRLLLASLLTLAIGLGALLAVGNVLLRVGVTTQATNVLRVQTEAQLASLRVTDRGVSLVADVNDAVVDRSSWVLGGSRVIQRPVGVPNDLDRTAVTLARQQRWGEHDGPGDQTLRVSPLRPQGSRQTVGAIVTGYAMEPLERLEYMVFFGSLVLAALVLVAGGVAIRGAIDGALRPVGRMTADAENWSAHDLDRRFDLGPPRDELTGLAATLDRLLARIAASRRHEQRFAGEVAHELRTPIAGLRARAELALAARGADAGSEHREALHAVVAGADRLDRAIDTLLAVARRELDPSSGSTDLVALASDVDGADVSVDGPLPAAEGEPEVVRRALAPLIDNARRHARERIAIELSATNGRVRLAVRDDGPGLDPGLGERAFNPGVRGSEGAQDGAGLGLPLARRLARSCGGDVVAGPGPGGHFVLELPAVGGSAVRVVVVRSCMTRIRR